MSYKAQFHELVKKHIRSNYWISEEEATEATEAIVDYCFGARCLTYGEPKIQELADYVANYMNK